jgi:hypothetical protein
MYCIKLLLANVADLEGKDGSDTCACLKRITNIHEFASNSVGRLVAKHVSLPNLLNGLFHEYESS